MVGSKNSWRPARMGLQLCGCESWTLTGEVNQKPSKTIASNGECLTRHIENTKQTNVGRLEFLLPTIKRCKLSWFGHFCCHATLAKIKGGSSGRGKLRKSWNSNIKEWTGLSLSSLLHIAGVGSQWATITATQTYVEYPPTCSCVTGQLITMPPPFRLAKTLTRIQDHRPVQQLIKAPGYCDGKITPDTPNYPTPK